MPIPILMYHWFRAARSISVSRSPQLEITPEFFERQIRFLYEKGYRSIPLNAALSGGFKTGLPTRPIVLTVDDGTLDFWTFGRPILEKYGFTALIFVVTGCVGAESRWDRHLREPPRPLMTWDQILKLQQTGFDIGSHTQTHRNLTELDDQTAWSEIAASKKLLTEKLGVPSKFLAYPRGRYNAKHKEMARKAGYQAACAVVLHWKDLARSDFFELKRMTIKGTESMTRFKMRLGLSKMISLTRTSRN